MHRTAIMRANQWEQVQSEVMVRMHSVWHHLLSALGAHHSLLPFSPLLSLFLLQISTPRRFGKSTRSRAALPFRRPLRIGACVQFRDRRRRLVWIERGARTLPLPSRYVMIA